METKKRKTRRRKSTGGGGQFLAPHWLQVGSHEHLGLEGGGEGGRTSPAQFNHCVLSCRVRLQLERCSSSASSSSSSSIHPLLSSPLPLAFLPPAVTHVPLDPHTPPHTHPLNSNSCPRVCMSSSPHVLVSLSRVLMSSSPHVLVTSCPQVLMSSCPRVPVTSCPHHLMSSCPRSWTLPLSERGQTGDFQSE